MTANYDRRFEVLIDDEVFIAETPGMQFKVTFNILLDYNGFHSYADISIYNIGDEDRARLKKGVKLGFRAGYVDNIDYIFKGAIRNVFKERLGPDSPTRIIARGGSQPKTSINKTMGRNTRVVDLIRACVGAMEYPLVINEKDFETIPPYARGYALNGDPRVYLDTLANAHNFSYIVENERVVVTLNTSYRQGGVILINEFNGMDGIPEVTEIGCNVRVRLNPAIRMGKRIEVESEVKTFNFSNLYFQDVPEKAGTGLYRVFRLRYTGDSWGDDWTTAIEAIR